MDPTTSGTLQINQLIIFLSNLFYVIRHISTQDISILIDLGTKVLTPENLFSWWPAMGLLKRASINGTPPYPCFWCLDDWVGWLCLEHLWLFWKSFAKIWNMDINIYIYIYIWSPILWYLELGLDKLFLQINPPSPQLKRFWPQLSSNLGRVAMAVPAAFAALKCEIKDGEKIITNPLRMKISESGWHTYRYICVVNVLNNLWYIFGGLQSVM